MKRLLFSLVALVLTSLCFAQDVLVKKDGSTIAAKILRITETEVEYKNFDNPDGPTRVISISSLLRINYQNGQTETFAAGTPDDIVTKETATKFSNDHQLLQIYNSMKVIPIEVKVKRLKIAGWVVGGAFVAGGIVMTSFLLHTDCYEWSYYGDYTSTVHDHALSLGTGLPMIGAGLSIWTGCYVRAKKLEKKSKYSVDASPVFQQEFNVGKHERLMVGVDVLNDNTMKHQTVGMGLRYNF